MSSRGAAAALRCQHRVEPGSSTGSAAPARGGAGAHGAAGTPSLPAMPCARSRRGEKYPKPKLVPSNTHLIVCWKDQVIPGSKPGNSNKSFILTLHSRDAATERREEVMSRKGVKGP